LDFVLQSLNLSRAAVLRAAGGKAFAAQHRPARLRFEGYAVRLTALIANNLEPFAFGSPATFSRTTKISTARIAARLAALGMAQATLAVIFLFSFGKWERTSAFGAGNF
jgi:hypothetical protein